MNVSPGCLWPNQTGGDAFQQLRTCMTHYGFSVSVVPPCKYDRTFLSEMLFKLAGVLFIPAGGIALLVPGLIHGPAQLPVQLGLLASFIFIGVALHRRADRGFRRKVYVDSTREEVRIGTANVAGQFYQTAVYPLTKIDSFFIVRAKTPTAPSCLKMRLKSGARTISLFEGAENTLIRILERITVTLRPPQKTGNRRFKTTMTGAFIRMAFN